MALDDGGVAAAALDHVGIYGSLRQHVDFAELFRFGFKNADEFLPDDPPLFLRLVDSFQTVQKTLLRIDAD